MIQVHISEQVAHLCSNLHLFVIECDVNNTASDEMLWKEIDKETEYVRATMKLDEISHWNPIHANRLAYKALGKDPNRYRPSAEALRRRILRELPLYKIDTLVDIINLVSIRSGYSIGGFDVNKISGKNLTLGVGQDGEVYHGIGRGILNISGLPVYRDEIGGIGTPTSDEERTKIDMDTNRLLMIINGYSGLEGLNEAGTFAIELLKRYVKAENLNAKVYDAANKVEEILLSC